MVDTTKLSFLKAVYTLLCAIGLIVHMSLITIDYLRYDTVTSVYIEFPIIVHSPALSVCFKYTDLIDRDWLINTYGQRLGFNANSKPSWAIIRAIRMNITMNDIFQRTPSARECCNNGMVRNGTHYGMKYLIDQNRVLDHFEVSRFFVHEAICYRFQLHFNQKYNYSQLGSSTFSGTIYVIGFSSTVFKRASHIIPIIHTANEYPINSVKYSPVAKRTFDLKNGDSLYSVSNQRLETHSLKYPYRSNCIDYHSKPRSDLIRECVIQLSLKRLELLPYSEMHYESEQSNYDRSSTTKLAHPASIIHNRTLLDGFNAIRDDCDQYHKNIQCDTSFHTTFIDSRSTMSWNSILVEVKQPIRPTISTIYQPTQDFYTFSLLILSCFGVWLGWSLSDCNPVNLVTFLSNLRPGRQQFMRNSRKCTLLKTEMIEMKMKMVELDMSLKQLRARHKTQFPSTCNWFKQ